MRVFDPIYGRFDLPAVMDTLLSTPEVRRLCQIRLLNTISPTLATLGEVRRYSHTLGVLYLSTKLRLRDHSDREQLALMSAVLLHDVGTPPFGHLFEYHLRERSHWSHEDIPHRLLTGGHAPENVAHQLFGGRTLEFRNLMERQGIDTDLVRSILRGEHKLSPLLFGSLDLDNLDNVTRMAWTLGMGGHSRNAIDLASSLGVGTSGELQLRKEMQPAVSEWSRVRRTVYEVLVFDPSTVAAQAVLSRAIGLALQEDSIDRDWWDLYDEELIEMLRDNSATKDLIREYLGRLPAMAFAIQLSGSLEQLGLESRAKGEELVSQVLRSAVGVGRSHSYVFEDRGAFSKEVRFRDPDTGEHWQCGSKSSSTVFYGFIRHGGTVGFDRCHRAAMAFIDEIPSGGDLVMRMLIGPSAENSNVNYSFDFAPKAD